jgi:hypothetical protein
MSKLKPVRAWAEVYNGKIVMRLDWYGDGTLAIHPSKTLCGGIGRPVEIRFLPRKAAKSKRRS